jgi:RNA polymerase primary sigma factor
MNNTYYNDLRKLKTINDEKVKEIYTRIDAGDSNAINEIIQANLRFVVMIAKQYYKIINKENIIELDDLISEGNIGLILAAQKFKVEFGVKFSTYAVHWIRKTIQETIEKNSDIIRLPVNKIIANRKIKKIANQLYQSNQCEATKEQLEELELFTKQEIDEYFNQKNIISIETQFNIEDIIEVDNDSIEFQSEMKRKISLALKHLTPKERMIIKMTYGIDQTPLQPAEIWKILGISRQRISQLRIRALNKLKVRLKNIEL